MKLSDRVVLDLRDLFNEVGFEGSLEDCLVELSGLVARVLSAKGCTIALLTEEEASRAEIGHRSGFGFLPGTPARLRKSLPEPALASGPADGLDSPAPRVDSMFSTIVLHGKLVGVIQAVQPQEQASFSRHDLDLFTILTPIITKSIQVIQLQQLLKSRFTQIALSKSGKSSEQASLTGVMQNPNQIARILARSFYREMLRAGFSFNQILFAATEVISELSAAVRQHRSRRKQRSIIPGDHGERFWDDVADQAEPLAGSAMARHVDRLPG